MIYREKYQPDDIKNGQCPECGAKRFIYLNNGTVMCNNCQLKIGNRFNKYGAKRTEFKGKMYDSKFEASLAEHLELLLKANEIKDYDTQFKLTVNVYNSNGDVVATKSHKVDFRVWNNDGSYSLVEAKGRETDDYKWRKDIVVATWLSEHLDYDYQVIKQKQVFMPKSGKKGV